MLDELGFVGGHAIHHQMNGLVAIAHHLLEKLDEQLRVEATLIGRIPEGAF